MKKGRSRSLQAGLVEKKVAKGVENLQATRVEEITSSAPNAA